MKKFFEKSGIDELMGCNFKQISDLHVPEMPGTKLGQAWDKAGQRSTPNISIRVAKAGKYSLPRWLMPQNLIKSAFGVICHDSHTNYVQR